MVHAATASGEQLSTMSIYKGCIHKFICEEMLSKGWLHGASESGLITIDLFFQWMQKLFVSWLKRGLVS